MINGYLKNFVFSTYVNNSLTAITFDLSFNSLSIALNIPSDDEEKSIFTESADHFELYDTLG